MPKIFYFLLFLSNIALAQTEPSFQSRFFFEDAAGNKDTLYWGADLTATLDNDFQLGENFIDEPFDSVFEVRATTDYFGDLDYTANPIVTPLYDLPSQFNCDIGGPNFFYIFMSLRYPPITITWDNVEFDDVCRLKSFMTPIEHNLIDTPNDDYWTCTPNVCLSESTSFQFDFLPESYGCVSAQDIGIYRTQELNNGTIDTIRGILYESHTSQGNWGPCAQLMISDVEDLFFNEKLSIEIYPNPTSDVIKIKSKNNNAQWKKMEIFTLQGEKIESQLKKEDEFSYSFKDYPAGIYFLKFLDTEGRVIQIEKVVKM